jgi:hypothetical protein
MKKVLFFLVSMCSTGGIVARTFEGAPMGIVTDKFAGGLIR